MKKILFLCLLVSGGVWANDDGLSFDEREAQFRKQIEEDLAKATDPVEIEKNSKEMWARHNERFSKPTAKIGMTEEQVIKNTLWGEPSSKNFMTTKYGTREQWVYDNVGYLYFENGKVVGIQSF
ncbi:MAG: hypothetical protein BGO19_02340 [Acinetobacter sp. 38-8]|nr:MAG: hypothetical protein BGO19_02340 [Acinetobacter sp. 38-8]